MKIDEITVASQDEKIIHLGSKLEEVETMRIEIEKRCKSQISEIERYQLQIKEHSSEIVNVRKVMKILEDDLAAKDEEFLLLQNQLRSSHDSIAESQVTSDESAYNSTSNQGNDGDLTSLKT
jgi:chromosome segregation ATPase